MPCLYIKTYVAKNVINKGKKTIPVNNNENFMSNFPFVLKEIAINNIHVYGPFRHLLSIIGVKLTIYPTRMNAQDRKKVNEIARHFLNCLFFIVAKKHEVAVNGG